MKSHTFSELMVGTKKWVFIKDISKIGGFVAEWNVEKNVVDSYASITDKNPKRKTIKRILGSDVSSSSGSSSSSNSNSNSSSTVTSAIRDVSFRAHDIYHDRTAQGITEIVQHAGEVIYVPEGVLHGAVCLTDRYLVFTLCSIVVVIYYVIYMCDL